MHTLGVAVMSMNECCLHCVVQGLESRGEQGAHVQGAGHGAQQSFTVNKGRTGKPQGGRVKI